MVETADVVVIGGGCMGTSIAMRLAQRGVKKVVLAEKKYVASGQTGKAVANIRPYTPDEEVMKMMQRSVDIFRNFGEEIGGDPGLVLTTRLRMVPDKDKKALEAEAEWQKKRGVNLRVLSPVDIKEVIPQLNVEGVGVAVQYLDAGYVNPVATTGAYATRARDLGADIREETEVTAIKVSGGKVQSVVTNKGEISTSVVVNAAGVWAASIGQMVGVDIPIEARRDQMCFFLRPWDFHGIIPTIHDVAREHVYKCEGDDILLVTDAAEANRPESLIKDPDNYDEEADEASLRLWLREMPLLLPPMKRGSYRGGYVGLLAITPDQNYILGKVPEVEGFYLCVSPAQGLYLSPTLSEVMAELITEDKTTLIDWTIFRLSRFKEGKPLTRIHGYRSE